MKPDKVRLAKARTAEIKGGAEPTRDDELLVRELQAACDKIGGKAGAEFERAALALRSAIEAAD